MVILNNMNKTIKRYNILLIMITFTFFIMSVVLIKNSSYILGTSYNNLYLKESVFYVLLFLITFKLLKYDENILIKYTNFIYYFSLSLIIFVLFFGIIINNSRGWINIFSISIEPSEFMKFALVLKLSSIFKDKRLKDNKKLMLGLIYTIFPFILVLLEPDTGNALMYIFIYFTCAFVSEIKLKYFIIIFSMMLLILIIFFYIYFFNLDLFKSVFSETIYYRIHRVVDFISKSGYQLNNSLIMIGSSNLIGSLVPLIYIPEAYTDFIFPILISRIGFLGGVLFIILYTLFFIIIIKKSYLVKKEESIYIVSALSIFIISFIINVGMCMGLLPITGITLPFISYGGSSLFSSFMLLYIILNPKIKSTR